MGKIGFVSISHEDYLEPAVFEAIKQAEQVVRSSGHQVVAVQEPAVCHRTAQNAGKKLASSGLDGVVLFLASWIECPTMMTVIREVEHLPLCVWGFPMFDDGVQKNSTGSYVAFSMFKGTLDRIGQFYVPILAAVDSAEAKNTIDLFCCAAVCRSRLRHCRMLLVGYTSMGIYPGTFDHVFMRVKIGPEIEQRDAYSLIRLAEESTKEEQDSVIELYRKHAVIRSDVSEESLRKSAGLYIAMRRLALDNQYEAINVKCQYEFSKEYKMTPCVPLSLLAETGVVASCEGDILNTVSMYILHCLTDQVIGYGDAMHHQGDVVLFSSCGFIPFSLGKQGEQVIGNFMPHPGFTGIQNSFVMRPGRVTLMRLVEDRCDYHIIYFTGEGLPTMLRQGYMPALEVRLDGDVGDLVSQYAGQHYAICYGDASEKIEMLARFLHIKAIRI